jgi:hypothetical protein
VPRLPAATLGLLLLGLSPAAAQQPACADSDTIQQCWARFFPEELLTETETDSITTGAADGAVAGLSRKNNGIGSLGDAFASSVNDFLPSIAGALGFTQATTEDGTASFEKNLLLPFGTRPQRLRLRALLRQPSPYAPLADTLTALGRSSRIAELERGLRDYDDLRLSLGWNLENGTFGRSFEEFRADYAALLDNLVLGLNTEARNAAVFALTEHLPEPEDVAEEQREIPACKAPFEDESLEALPLSCLEPAFRAEFTAALSAAAGATAAVEAGLAEEMIRIGFHEFDDLIDNQPQLSVEVATELRRDAVGPNGFEATLRYEGGFANVNSLRQHCRGAAGAGLTPACLQGYLERPGVRTALRRGDRFFVSGRFTRRADFRLEVPRDTLVLVAAGTWDLTGGAGVGRYVSFNRAGEGIARVDLAAEYIHHHDDPARENRLVITGTYTQRLSGSLTVAAGFSYSNRPEFVGEVDQQVTANFGLRYKLTQD